MNGVKAAQSQRKIEFHVGALPCASADCAESTIGKGTEFRFTLPAS